MSSPNSQNAYDTIKTALMVVVGSLTLVIGIGLIAHFAIGAYGGRSLKGDPAMSDEAVAARLKPVAELVIVDANAPKVSKSGEQIYAAVCSACHAAGVLNAPKFGDKASWAPHIAAGYDPLVANAIKGIRGMPARGGNPDLTDVEVARAVVHMANAAGANFKAPEPKAEAAPISATASAPEPAMKPAAAAVVSVQAVAPVAAVTKADSSKGKTVYEATCAVCHGAGVAGAPKFADKAAWAPRVAQGADMLHNHALKGFQGKVGVMPPKGGNGALSDADVIAAVDYMVSQAK